MWTRDNPPNYTQCYMDRARRLKAIRADPVTAAGAWHFYSTHPIEFIEDWCETVDPRKAATGEPVRMPFIMFERQHDFVRFLLDCIEQRESGLVEKCRDMGATWVACAFSVWLWLFKPGAVVGWGSRKQDFVDRLGVMDSIFEKIRAIIRNLPPEFLPAGFSFDVHATFMKVQNPATGASIVGEAGDNIGRGGRTLIYFVDEAAHLERPELSEASLGDNTNTRIDISSVNGTGNVFHRKRESGAVWPQPARPGQIRVMIMDWRDHPAKDQEWYEKRRRNYFERGLLHVFAQEVDRNYAAAVEGIIIRPEWVRAAIDAHKVLGFDDDGAWISSLDVADGGQDRNAQVIARGSIIRFADDWQAEDTGETTRRALGNARTIMAPRDLMRWQYDAIGVGAGVKAECNRLMRDDEVAEVMRRLTVVPWIASAAPLDPKKPIIKGDKKSPLAEDIFTNLKAQAWFMVARRFELTYRAVRAARGEGEPVEWTVDQVVSIDGSLPRLRELEKELSQATMGEGARLKMVVNKTPDGTRSPNLADGAIMTLFPVRGAGGLTIEQLRRAL